MRCARRNGNLGVLCDLCFNPLILLTVSLSLWLTSLGNPGKCPKMITNDNNVYVISRVACRIKKKKIHYRDSETMRRRKEELSQKPQRKRKCAARGKKLAFSAYSEISVFQNPFRTGQDFSVPRCPDRHRDLQASLDHPIKSGDDERRAAHPFRLTVSPSLW